MNISLLFNIFQGEISPLVAARVDSPAYEMGAKRMENMIPMPAGGLRKRPGTWYDGTTKDNSPARLIDWLLSDGSCAVIELTAGTTGIWRRQETIPGYEELPEYEKTQEIPNEYGEEDIAGVKYAASSDNLWLVHPGHPPQRLAWDGDAVSQTYPEFTGKDFAAEGGRPGAAMFYAGRLCFAATRNEPNKIYLSKPPDSMTGEERYTDFTIGDNPADAIVLEENDMHGSRIQWLAVNRGFLAATERAVWSDTGEVPTPATFDMNIIEYAGAAGLQPRGTKEIMVYAARGGKALRAVVWTQQGQSGGFIDMDISEQAAHLFTRGIKDFAVSDYPYPVIWVVTRAGELISCTVNIRAGMLAYARHPTEGAVEAVAVSSDKTGDVIFLEVKRGSARNIEHLVMEDLVSADYAESHYVDAGERRVFDTPTRVVTGLERFAGKTVRAFVDGALEPPVTVSADGTAEFQTDVVTLHIGLPYKSVFSPNTRLIPANGTSLGKKRRLEKVILRLYKSLGGRVGPDEEKTEELITRRLGSYVLGTVPEPFTGDIDVDVSGNIDTETEVLISHDDPVPFTLLALVERVAVLEA
ncbi:MAG: hypothetical protein LBP76_10270 [Treponema sp.]|jgi:hypothetical protein|nr:hypothetical protein [Treponema sp.]